MSTLEVTVLPKRGPRNRGRSPEWVRGVRRVRSGVAQTPSAGVQVGSARHSACGAVRQSVSPTLGRTGAECRAAAGRLAGPPRPIPAHLPQQRRRPFLAASAPRPAPPAGSSSESARPTPRGGRGPSPDWRPLGPPSRSSPRPWLQTGPRGSVQRLRSGAPGTASGSRPGPTPDQRRAGQRAATLYMLFYYKTTEHTCKIHHLATTSKAQIFEKKDSLNYMIKSLTK